VSTAVATERVTIDLDFGCCGSDLATRIHEQLNVPKYTHGMSLMPCPDSLADWQAEHRTARKRAWRSERLGYRFAEVDMSLYADDRYEINTSKQERQGRPMTDGYRAHTRIGRLPDYPCDRHAIRTYGVLQGDTLRAYMTLYRVGDLGMVSMILGHGDHLRHDIMYLLFAGMIGEQAGAGGTLFYNRHDSGTEGLRFFKERLGFRAGDIDWRLA
jgi:hypothetical protein